MRYVLGRQLASLYGPLGPALVKFPTIFPTQLYGECVLAEWHSPVRSRIYIKSWVL